MRKSPDLEELAQFFLIWNLQSVPLWPLKNLGFLRTSLWSFISVILFCLGVYFYLASIWNRFTNWECISTTWFECFAVCLEFKTGITFSSVIEMWRCLGYNFCPPLITCFVWVTWLPVPLSLPLFSSCLAWNVYLAEEDDLPRWKSAAQNTLYIKMNAQQNMKSIEKEWGTHEHK